MNTTLHRILAFLALLFGLFVASAYAVLVALADDRGTAVDEWGTLAGFGMFAGLVGLAWLLATFGRPSDGEPVVPLPSAYLSFFTFAVLVGVGFGLQYAERAQYLGPLLAVLAFVAVTTFFLRIATRWMPNRALPVRNVLLPGIWGVFVAPMMIMILQGGAIVLLAFGIFTGIAAENPDFELDPNLGDRISNYLEDSESGTSSTTLPEIVETPTVALTLVSVVAVIAPLSEELVKALGAILLLSRLPVVTRADAFQAAVAAGLGFAIFEGVGYTLASPSSWQQLILIRAPVVVMHVAATTIVVLGWYRMRETGRGFLWYFAAGTLLHAGWNASAVGFVYSLTGIDAGSDPSTGQALGIFTVALILGALLVLASAWFVFAARKAGHSARQVVADLSSVDPRPVPSSAILPSG